MKNSQRLKIGFSLFIISIILFFLLYSFQPVRTSNELSTTKSEQNVSDFMVEENSNLEGKVKGENSIIKFEKDLETSLKIQDAPKIWLEFTNEKNEIQKVKLPKQVLEIIHKRWSRMLYYSDKISSAKNREEKLEIYENYINDAAVFATTIDNFEINTPSEKRKISTDEAFAMLKLAGEFAIERYEQLQIMDSQIKPQEISL